MNYEPHEFMHLAQPKLRIKENGACIRDKFYGHGNENAAQRKWRQIRISAVPQGCGSV